MIRILILLELREVDDLPRLLAVDLGFRCVVDAAGKVLA